MNMMFATFPLRLGDLGTWVGSVITGAALFIAFWQMAILRRDRDSRQAALISMWISNKTLRTNSTQTGLNVTIECSYLNASTQPVGLVRCEVRLGSQKIRGIVGPVAPDGVVQKKLMSIVDMSVDDANAKAELDIWFTDEAGHRWRRNHEGRLKEGVKLPSDWTELSAKWGIAKSNPPKDGE